MNKKSKYEQWDNSLIDSLGEEKSIKKLFKSLEKLYKLVIGHDLDTDDDDQARGLLENLNEMDTQLFQGSIDHLEHLPVENSMHSMIRIASIATQREEITKIIIVPKMKQHLRQLLEGIGLLHHNHIIHNDVHVHVPLLISNC